jgi:hypothetical protein
VFGVFANDSVVKSNLSAFVQCFDTGLAPAAGYARTLIAANVDRASLSNDWNLLENQAALLTNISLIAKGTVDGRFRGFVYEPGSGTYQPDSTNLTALTRAELRTKILAGDTLTILGVPIGTEQRLGIDRDLDGTLDGDLPAPQLHIAATGAGAVVSWPTNVTGFVLERAPNLPANWSPDTNLRGRSGNEFNVTNALSLTNLFFRLREL